MRGGRGRGRGGGRDSEGRGRDGVREGRHGGWEGGGKLRVTPPPPPSVLCTLAAFCLMSVNYLLAIP